MNPNTLRQDLRRNPYIYNERLLKYLQIVNTIQYITMSSLEALGIAGFRSYSTETLQKIEFKVPLTLIWGKNGSGKTTIIEALKYITTGTLPPSCEKGKNFIIEPRIMGKSEVSGEVRLKFKAFNQRPVLATRRCLLSLNNKGTKFQSVEQILKTKDEKGQMIEINHQCAEIEKQIPILLGTSKAILQKIVFCHQDESLWPFEDSATLKSIFDELFETRKYTQVIEGLWQQRKQYQKRIGQMKKALPYLHRLYEEDQRRKANAMSELQEVNQATINVRQMKEKLNKIQAEIGVYSDEAGNKRKYDLGRDRRLLEQKIISYKAKIEELKVKVQSLHASYLSQEGIELKIDLRQSQLRIPQLTEQLNIIIAKYNQLNQKLRLLESARILDQQQFELNSQIINAKEFLPEYKDQRLSEQEVLRKLAAKCESLRLKREQLITCKRQLEKCTVPSVVIQVSMSEQQYQQQKNSLNLSNISFNEIKQKIFRFYFSLYKHVDDKSILHSKVENLSSLSNKLTQTQCRLKIKREQLEHLQSISTDDSINIRDRIKKLQFVGIQFYQGYIEYCIEKQKCSLCSKPISPEELTVICAKSQKMKEKTIKQIAQLEKNLPKGTEQLVHGINPQQIRQQLTQEITRAEEQQRLLIAQVKECQRIAELRQQLKVNEKLRQGIRVTRLQKELETTSSQSSSKSSEATLDNYAQTVKKMLEIQRQIEMKKGNISKYQQQVKKNRQIQLKSQEVKGKRKILLDKVNLLEEQTKNFQIINRIYIKLSGFLKQKINRPFQSNSQKAAKASIQELNHELSKCQRIVKALSIEKEFHQSIVYLFNLQNEQHENERKINDIDTQMNIVESDIRKIKSTINEYNTLKVEYEKKQREIDLKAEIIFQEYYKPLEKEYLIEKSKLENAEAASRDIEVYCLAIENAISTIHKQKMDEVNKIIADIWQEVYHQHDISKIQILTKIEEDSRKKKSYHYSIMMDKTGSNSAKVQMKGRCSMGQKVLASIVIRLALAQVFSNASRILALDEPTTFLDRNHINKLAQSLGKLIEMNEGGALQLIIISHDLDFIRRMEKYTTHYYQVSRDPNQFSVITPKEIREIFTSTNEV